MRKKYKKVLAAFISAAMLFTTVSDVAAAGRNGELAKEHVHNTGGWECSFSEIGRDLICEKGEHIHTEDCISDVDPLILGSSSNADENNACDLPEHTHDDACYSITKGWKCSPPLDREESDILIPTTPTNAGKGNSNIPISDEICVEKLRIIVEDNEVEEALIGSSDSIAVSLGTVLSGPDSKSVTLGYRLTIPEKSQSGGTFAFSSSSYQWLTAFDGGKPEVEIREGNLILEGKVTAESGQGNVVPGEYLSSVTIISKNLVNGEVANLKAECWVYEKDGESKKKEKDLKIISKTESIYKLYHNTVAGVPVVSGFFNKETGEFSISEPTDPSGFQYGRVVRFRLFAWNDGSTERPDPTKPISFDFSYKLKMAKPGEELTEVSTPDEQPVLMAVKRSDIDVKGSQLDTTPVQGDVTLGGIIKDDSGYNGVSNEGFYHGGDYTFQENKNGSVNVSAILSRDDKNSNYKHVAVWGLIFVPLNPLDPMDSYRRLEITADNLKGTSYSGAPISDKTSGFLQWYKILPKKAGGSLEGLFTRTVKDISDSKTVLKGNSARIVSTLTNKDPDNIADYDINAINILVKFDTKGYEYNAQWWDKLSNDNFSGTQTRLFAVKKDKSGWKDDYEMNHTEDKDLFYYKSMEEAKKHGPIVGVLLEFRGK